MSYRRFVISQNRHQVLPCFQSISSISETPAASVALDNIKDLYNFRDRKYFNKALKFYKKSRRHTSVSRTTKLVVFSCD